MGLTIRNRYVSSIHIPNFAPDTLISGGGDPTLKIWDWMTGRVKAEVEVWTTVQNFMKVKGFKKGHGDLEDEGGDNAQGGKTRKERRKGRSKRQQDEKGNGEYMQEASGDLGSGAENIKPSGSEAEPADPGELVQVIHKIDSLESGSTRYLLFSTVGYVF